MRLIIVLAVITAINLSCKQESADVVKDPLSPMHIRVADNIIYDVVVRAETDDEWDIEKVAGYSGNDMIDSLFESLYSGELKARDYHSGKELSPQDIKIIEKQEGFERNNIGKIQFTEDWYFSPSDNNIEKRVETIVFGYKTNTEDRIGVGYMAAFEIMMNQITGQAPS
jgi:hypothetical protein